jgi:hypothetical protein
MALHVLQGFSPLSADPTVIIAVKQSDFGSMPAATEPTSAAI